METTSIMSFNDTQALQSALTKVENSNVNVYELALHAMRDRCLLLQRRINTLENDNMRLKVENSKALSANYHSSQDSQKFSLEQRIAELTKQKSLLTQHVFMVTCENKNLWNKIGSIKKSNKEASADPSDSPSKHSKLLRTNTYIHSSTPKIIDSGQDKFSEASLEEISLKLINSYIQEKSQLVEQYEQMAELQQSEEPLLNVNYVGFNYVVEPGTDSLKEMQTQIEKLDQLKKVVIQQQADMQEIIDKFEKIIKDGPKCKICALRNNKLVTSEHKEIETSDSLANFATPAASSIYNETITNKEKPSPTGNNKDNGRICPMCGESFGSEYPFEEFNQHVQDHFIGDPEEDSVLNTYDYIKSNEV